jgi:hypothetical protein
MSLSLWQVQIEAWRVVRVASGQSGKWPKWRVVLVASGQSGKCSRWLVPTYKHTPAHSGIHVKRCWT